MTVLRQEKKEKKELQKAHEITFKKIDRQDQSNAKKTKKFKDMIMMGEIHPFTGKKKKPEDVPAEIPDHRKRAREIYASMTTVQAHNQNYSPYANKKLPDFDKTTDKNPKQYDFMYEQMAKEEQEYKQLAIDDVRLRMSNFDFSKSLIFEGIDPITVEDPSEFCPAEPPG